MHGSACPLELPPAARVLRCSSRPAARGTVELQPRMLRCAPPPSTPRPPPTPPPPRPTGRHQLCRVCVQRLGASPCACSLRRTSRRGASRTRSLCTRQVRQETDGGSRGGPAAMHGVLAAVQRTRDRPLRPAAAADCPWPCPTALPLRITRRATCGTLRCRSSTPRCSMPTASLGRMRMCMRTARGCATTRCVCGGTGAHRGARKGCGAGRRGTGQTRAPSRPPC